MAALLYDLKGKVALVTGAAGERGIGRAIAVRLATEGASVAINDVSDEPRGTWGGLAAVAAEIEATGASALRLTGSIADAADVQRLVDTTVDGFGRLDILVNNAGAPAGADRRPIVELEESEWTRVHDVNARGTFLMCKAGGRHMIDRGGGGRIVNVASLAGRIGIPRYGAYCASKFAIVGLTQALAHELGPHGVTVNAICPGLTDTERLAGMASGLRPEGTSVEAYRQELVEQNVAITPLGRIAQPEDVARTAVFLASDEAGFLTGQSVSVSGGAWMA
jgi:3-oxoacyl-[acyl-carrier protein] reductase/meso-butanediol dehydrogenase/(S,S)-butanediol dehydrogenase/diacetyl reductase